MQNLILFLGVILTFFFSKISIFCSKLKRSFALLSEVLVLQLKVVGFAPCAAEFLAQILKSPVGAINPSNAVLCNLFGLSS